MVGYPHQKTGDRMKSSETDWKTYLENELPLISAILFEYGITLAENQPHIQGERFLIQALTTIGGKKLILIGTDTKHQRPVVIKATNDPVGKQELLHERTCRSLLHEINFSYESFHSPKEYYFIEKNGYVLYVGEFIEQTSSFLERPIAEQFSFALRALKAQEETRATTAKHLSNVARVFGTRTSREYLSLMNGFVAIAEQSKEFADSATLLTSVAEILVENQTRIEQYSGFLTHTDFVPHNFRIRDNVLYLLDFSSLRFGNKHEGWARFLNFMILYNRELERLLTNYIKDNRSTEEQESLHLLRLFRLSELTVYYIGTLKKSSGQLHELNRARVLFWSQVLDAKLHHTEVSDDVVASYIATRDSLRSEGEKLRQRGLH